MRWRRLFAPGCSAVVYQSISIVHASLQMRCLYLQVVDMYVESYFPVCGNQYCFEPRLCFGVVIGIKISYGRDTKHTSLLPVIDRGHKRLVGVVELAVGWIDIALSVRVLFALTIIREISLTSCHHQNQNLLWQCGLVLKPFQRRRVLVLPRVAHVSIECRFDTLVWQNSCLICSDKCLI